MEHVDEAFDDLEEFLGAHGMQMDVLCVGGYVLERHGIRATMDVDAFFKADAEVRRAIWDIGERYGINDDGEPWLNDSVANVNAWPPDKECSTVREGPFLRVREAPLSYVAGMKMESMRDRDIDDIGAIMRTLAVDTVDGAVRRLERVGFQNADEGVLLEAMGREYGTKWMESEALKMFSREDDAGPTGGPYPSWDDGLDNW